MVSLSISSVPAPILCTYDLGYCQSSISSMLAPVCHGLGSAQVVAGLGAMARSLHLAGRISSKTAAHCCLRVMDPSVVQPSGLVVRRSWS